MKPFFYKLISAVTIILVVTYLCACTTAYISPLKAWPLVFLALGFPILAAFMLVLAIGWLFLNRKISLAILLISLIGFANLRHVFALNFAANDSIKKTPSTLKIISWNVHGFDNNGRYFEHPDSARRRMINFLKEQNADVLLLQEFVEYHNPAIYSNVQVLHDTLGYKYYYASNDISVLKSYGHFEAGSIMFSKWPMTDSVKMLFDNVAVPEHAISALINFKGKKVRITTTHLASLNLYNHIGPETPDERIIRSDSAFINEASKKDKLIHYENLHVGQARQLKKFISGFSGPSIVGGDFNTVPSGYPYNIVSKGLNDAFLQKGFGIGRTFSSVSPTLRIDYLFTSKDIKTLSYHCPKLFLSDHFPLIVNVSLP